MTDQSTNGIVPPPLSPIEKLAARIASLTAEFEGLFAQANFVKGRLEEAKSMLAELQKSSQTEKPDEQLKDK